MLGDSFLKLFIEFLGLESNPKAIFGKLKIPLKKVFYVQNKHLSVTLKGFITIEKSNKTILPLSDQK